MTGVSVTELGYLGLSVSNPEAWKDFAANIAGLEVVDEGEADRFYLRMDEWHHRITVHNTGGDDLEYLGWRVAGREEFDAMARKLEEAGVSFRIASKEEATERHVLGLMKLEDPAGLPTEIFWGPRVEASRPFHPGRPLFGRFVTGSQGLGHLIIQQFDNEAAYQFYSLLGLRGGADYQVDLPNGDVAEPVFMHCNERHHSVAFGLPTVDGKRINHLMLEYTELDDLGNAHDIVRKREIDVALQLGKHSNDKALTFYHATPSGWLCELGWGAVQAPAQHEYYRGDIFGHGVEASGYGLDLEL